VGLALVVVAFLFAALVLLLGRALVLVLILFLNNSIPHVNLIKAIANQSTS
jgi:hypothetical protein